MADKRVDSVPVLNSAEQFEEWKRDIQVWQAITNIKQAKHGPILYRALEGQAKKACSGLPIEEICGQDGVRLILDKLETVFAKDSEQIAFEDCSRFENFFRPDSMSISEYINEFERLYDKLKTHKMSYADGILAYKLLINARISKEKQTMCRATMGTLTFENIKKQLKVIHDVTGHTLYSCNSNNDTSVKVKEESNLENESDENDVFYTNYRGRGFGRFGRRRGIGNRSYGSARSFEMKGKKKKNPVDSQGRITRCSVCESVYHWWRECPERENHSEEKIALFANEIPLEQYLPSFLKETLNCAVLDCGCVKSVCGSKWFEIYGQTLSDNEQKSVSEENSYNCFRFGVGGPIYNSKRKVKFPAKIGNKDIFIEADVIDCDIPLLLSKESMKKAQTVIDFNNDNAVMLGQKIKLNFTQSGHYSIPLCNFQEAFVSITENVFLKIEEMDYEKRLKAFKNIHIQFGHAGEVKLHNLLKQANVKDKEIFDLMSLVDKTCETCARFKRTPLRPVVGLSLAKDFNDTVSMDLKFFEQTIFLHMIDHATRYSSVCVIPNKRQDTVIQKIFEHWIAIFGPPKMILSDNGLEFNNAAMRELGNLLNIEIKTTAAESPWSNGITERHNAIIANMMKKILFDRKCSVELALLWAVSAKNSLSNVFGYSPNQLVFGKNPNLPSVLTDDPPALENVSSSELIAKHLNAVISARKAFVEAEANDKLKRALARKVRPSTSLIYEVGDKVFYKRKDDDKWRGPGNVIGKEKHQVFVKHGGVYVRVNPCHLRHVKEDIVDTADKEGIVDTADKDDDNFNELRHSDEQQLEMEKDCNEITEKDIESIPLEDKDEQNAMSESTEGTQNQRKVNDSSSNTSNIYSSSINPPIKSTVKYQEKDSEIWKTAFIESRAGKANGKYKDWYNVKDTETQNIECFDWKERVENWCPIETEFVFLSQSAHDSLDVLQAKEKELLSWKDHNVYQEHEDTGQPVLSTRWVCTTKDTENGKVHKARLVIRGYEENTEFLDKDSPTCHKESLRILFTICAAQSWTVNTLDIQAAFLQGKPIERPVYVCPPKEANTDKVWKLNKAAYGLNDASKQWYSRLSQEFHRLGLLKCKLDPAVFFQHETKSSRLGGLVASHVDDVVWAGTKDFSDNVIDQVKSTFNISREHQEHFTYVGLKVEQDQDHINLHQKDYIEEIKPVKTDGSLENDPCREISEQEKKDLRSSIGQLNWISTQTRPDIAYDVCQASVNYKRATLKDIKHLNKVIRRAKDQEVVLTFDKKIGTKMNDCSIICYADASFKNLNDGGSQGGFLIFLYNENTNCLNPIQWQSKRIKRIVRSALAAECLALQDGVEAAYLIREMIKELLGNSLKIIAMTDSKSLFDAINSTKSVDDKRLRPDIAALKEKHELGEVNVYRWIPTGDQLADSLTKAGASTAPLLKALSGGGVSSVGY